VRDKKDDKPKYEYPIYGINWTGGVGRPAGMYWLDGDIVIATHGSPAEADLIARGGILAATLRFDASPHERSHRGRTVEAVRPEMFLVGH